MPHQYSDIEKISAHIKKVLNPLMEFYKRDENINRAEDDREKSLLNFLIKLTGITPLIIAIDNIHWADSSTIRILQKMLKIHKKNPLLIIATIDEERLEKDGENNSAITEWKKELIPDTIYLTELTPGQTGEVVNSILMTEANQMSLFQEIYLSSSGNPLFIKEAVKFLVGSGQLKWKNKNWIPEKKLFKIPGSMEELMLRRIDQLTEETKDLLVKISLMGKTFPFFIYKTYAGRK